MSDDLMVRLRSTVDRLSRKAWNAGYTEAFCDMARMTARQLDTAESEYTDAEAMFDRVMDELEAERSSGHE